MPKQKPEKPYDEYPLFAHDNGQWTKKIRGKLYYFGKWEIPDEAFENYLRDKDHLLAGLKPPSQDGHTILEICVGF